MADEEVLAMAFGRAGTVVTIDKPPTLPLRADEWELASCHGTVNPPDGGAWWLVWVGSGPNSLDLLWARRRQTKDGT